MQRPHHLGVVGELNVSVKRTPWGIARRKIPLVMKWKRFWAVPRLRSARPSCTEVIGLLLASVGVTIYNMTDYISSKVEAA